MRARLLKPGFFSDADLVDLEPLTRLLFIGLWCLADREGRLVDRPRDIRMQVLPSDRCDCDAMLGALAAGRFIIRYEVDGERLIQIRKFTAHQQVHRNEAASKLPPPCVPSVSGQGPSSSGNVPSMTDQGRPLPEHSGNVPSMTDQGQTRSGNVPSTAAIGRRRPAEAEAEAVLEAEPPPQDLSRYAANSDARAREGLANERGGASAEVEPEPAAPSPPTAAPTPPPTGLPLRPSLALVPDDCRDAARRWLERLHAERNTERPGRRHGGVLAAALTAQHLEPEFSDGLAELAADDPAAFRGAVERMLAAPKGWITSPLRYLQGAVRIAGEEAQAKAQRKARPGPHTPPPGRAMTPAERAEWLREPLPGEEIPF
jgi:hypothetical protein